MSEYTPQHHPANPDPTADTTQTDLISGDPPVPITVWRTARAAGDAGDAGRSISTRLAARLIASYSRPGEIVVDVSADHALAAACGIGGRQHHPAWFTDASSLIIGPATPTPVNDSGTSADDAEADGDIPDLRAWFGDDLTDPDLPPGTDPITAPEPNPTLQRATSLVVATWPLVDGDAANRVRLAWLLTACARLLRPGGCLILVVAVAAGTPTVPEDFTDVVQAAASAGLGYLQHIVAVAADTDGDAFVYHVTDEELLALTDGGEQRWAVMHLRVHADLLVFSQLGKQRPAGRRQRGDHHG